MDPRGAVVSVVCPRCGALSPPSFEPMMTCVRCVLRFAPKEPVPAPRRRRRATEPQVVEAPPASASAPAGRGALLRPLAVVLVAFVALALALEMRAWPEVLQLVGLLSMLVVRRLVRTGDDAVSAGCDGAAGGAGRRG